MRDIRIYGYDSGKLVKLSRSMLHKCSSIEEAYRIINYCKIKKIERYVQYVIIEYFVPYKSKILQIVEGRG